MEIEGGSKSCQYMKHRETVPVRKPIKLISQLREARSHTMPEESVKMVDGLQLKEMLRPVVLGVGDCILQEE